MMIDMYEIVGMVDLPKKLAGGSMMTKYEMEQVFGVCTLSYKLERF